MHELELVEQTVDLPRGALRILQPREAADIPDAWEVEWAPLAPYWSVLWRSGVALARELDSIDVSGLRVVELGCGLAVPSIAAARAGSEVLATDAVPEAVDLARRNAERNGTRIETATLEWAKPEELVARGPFDLVLAADVLYERGAVAVLLDLLPELGARAFVADPGRAAADAFLAQASERWRVQTSHHGVVSIHELELDRSAPIGA